MQQVLFQQFYSIENDVGKKRAEKKDASESLKCICFALSSRNSGNIAIRRKILPLMLPTKDFKLYVLVGVYSRIRMEMK